MCVGMAVQGAGRERGGDLFLAREDASIGNMLHQCMKIIVVCVVSCLMLTNKQNSDS